MSFREITNFHFCVSYLIWHSSPYNSDLYSLASILTFPVITKRNSKIYTSLVFFLFFRNDPFTFGEEDLESDNETSGENSKGQADRKTQHHLKHNSWSPIQEYNLNKSSFDLDWSSVSHMIIYMFQCYFLKSFHPCLLPHGPKVCSLYLGLFCCLTYRVIVTIFLNSIYMHQYTVMMFSFLTYFMLCNRLQFHPPH